MLSIDVLYFDNCPLYKEAEKALREVLDEEHVDAEAHMVSVSEVRKQLRGTSSAHRPSSSMERI